MSRRHAARPRRLDVGALAGGAGKEAVCLGPPRAIAVQLADRGLDRERSLGSGLTCPATRFTTSAHAAWPQRQRPGGLAATASSRQAHLYQRILLLRGMKPFQILRVLAPSALYRSLIGRLMG
jgi:hypothetical protein